MTVDREVKGANGSDVFVPRIAITAAFVLVLASVAMFIVYINHVANMIRVSTIISGIGAETRALLEKCWPVDAPPGPASSRPDGLGHEIASPGQGVVVSVNRERLVQHACHHDALIEVVPRVGDFVPEGSALLRVHGMVGAASEVTRLALSTPNARPSRISRSASGNWWTSPRRRCLPGSTIRPPPARH